MICFHNDDDDDDYDGGCTDNMEYLCVCGALWDCLLDDDDEYVFFDDDNSIALFTCGDRDEGHKTLAERIKEWREKREEARRRRKQERRKRRDEAAAAVAARSEYESLTGGVLCG